MAPRPTSQHEDRSDRELLLEIFERVEMLPVISQRLGEVEKNTVKMHETLYGNGKPGLVTEIALLKQEHENQKQPKPLWITGILIPGGMTFVLWLLIEVLPELITHLGQAAQK